MQPIKFQVCAQLAKSIRRQRLYLGASRAMLRVHNVTAARAWLECWNAERAAWRKMLAWKQSI